jgi:hypothetical protein
MEDTRLCIRLESETGKETVELMNICARAKAPVVAFGSVSKDGFYAWFKIPLRKGDVVYFPVDNGVKDKRS